MSAAPIAPHLRALAPIFARQLGLILASLAALVARAFLRDPRLVLLIIPIYTRLNRAARRFAVLMACLAAGRLPRRRRGGGGGGRAPKPPIPTRNAWLIHALRHEAAAYASQLAHLLAEPGVADLLAAAPTSQRILNPIRRALGLPAGEPRPPPAPATRPSAPRRPSSSSPALPTTAHPTPPRPLLPTRAAFRPLPARAIILNPA